MGGHPVGLRAWCRRCSRPDRGWFRRATCRRHRRKIPDSGPMQWRPRGPVSAAFPRPRLRSGPDPPPGPAPADPDRYRMRPRSTAVTLPQVPCQARCAASTAASISAAPPRAIAPISAPVEGFESGSVWPEAGATHAPSIRHFSGSNHRFSASLIVLSFVLSSHATSAGNTGAAAINSLV